MHLFLLKIRSVISRHRLALVAAFLVGLIYGGPHIWFAATNDSYQGIPLMQSANEDFYLARMQEIIDGHPLVGSHGYFEYKDQFPLAPPTAEFLYALPTLIFGISIITTLTASKFLFPFILFLLAYALIYQLMGKEDSLSQKISAVAGGLFVTLGYDLVDYKTVFGYIAGSLAPGGWLIWSRPVNPILGAIFLFAFLLFVWTIIKKRKTDKSAILGASLFLAFMISSYFFSWGIGLSILFIMGLIYLLKHDYAKVKRLVFVFVIGVGLSLPYWYLSWQAKQSPWYEDSVLRSGLFYTRYPVLNKVLLASLALYAVILFLGFLKDSKTFKFKNWHFFIFSFLAGGIFAFSQQIITGMTIWPFHFVQYTIPLSIVALMVVFFRYAHERWGLLWKGAVGIILLASLWFGIYTQYSTYITFVDHFVSIQPYMKVFDWLNSQEKDCVVLSVGGEDLDQVREIKGMIPAFTHCNQYAYSWFYSLVPEDRIYYSYLVNLRLRGVTSQGIEDYIKKNRAEANVFLSSNWKGFYQIKNFPDFEDKKLSERLKNLPADYRAFLKKDFGTELEKYRLDYILSIGPLREDIKNQLTNLKLATEIDGIFLYQF